MAWSGYFLHGLLYGCGLEFGGAEVSQAAVQPGAVVPADVVDDGAAGAGAGGPGLQVDEFALDGAEETFRQGVVPALAGAAVRQGYLAVGGEGGEVARGVLREFSRCGRSLRVRGRGQRPR
jgi:hypothetical protein